MGCQKSKNKSPELKLDFHQRDEPLSPPSGAHVIQWTDRLPVKGAIGLVRHGVLFFSLWMHAKREKDGKLKERSACSENFFSNLDREIDTYTSANGCHDEGEW